MCNVRAKIYSELKINGKCPFKNQLVTLSRKSSSFQVPVEVNIPLPPGPDLNIMASQVNHPTYHFHINCLSIYLSIYIPRLFPP